MDGQVLSVDASSVIGFGRRIKSSPERNKSSPDINKRRLKDTAAYCSHIIDHKLGGGGGVEEGYFMEGKRRITSPNKDERRSAERSWYGSTAFSSRGGGEEDYLMEGNRRVTSPKRDERERSWYGSVAVSSREGGEEGYMKEGNRRIASPNRDETRNAERSWCGSTAVSGKGGRNEATHSKARGTSRHKDTTDSRRDSQAEQIIKTVLRREKGSRLGIEIEGGSDTPLQYICIKSLTEGSPAHACGLFRLGDQLVMIGQECVIGATLKQAREVLRRAPAVVQVIAQRIKPRPDNKRKSMSVYHYHSHVDHKLGGEEGYLKEGNRRSPSPNRDETRNAERSWRGSTAVSRDEARGTSRHEETMDGRRDSQAEQIIKTVLRRKKGSRLGIEIEGGSDTPLQYIRIKSLMEGSPAHACGLFRLGDQLVMIGQECIIGTTLKQAREVLRQAPAIVQVIAQRKKPSQPLTRTSPRQGQGSQGPVTLVAGGGWGREGGVRMRVVLRRGRGRRLGFRITGGRNDPYLRSIHVSAESVVDSSNVTRSQVSPI